MLPKIDKKFRLKERITKPFLRKINPDYISVLGLLLSIPSAYFIFSESYIPASIFLLLHCYCDILDGAIAKKYGATKKGDFLDHTFDRLSDVIIFLGVAFNPHVDLIIGFLTIIAMLLVSYLGTQAQALTKKRLYGGFGRADRFLFLFISLVVSEFVFVLDYCILLIFILSLISFVYRFFSVLKSL
ncbi:MAG: CDP-alcohol phosphatidyltransferase family protein [Candidatus Aenigmarchaeota archaeon]|nr:CDP-alcohol phosphatidyltransferase family protein [Candidatus Aenigmarchaeota archaeon]